jgi:predicted permease
MTTVATFESLARDARYAVRGLRRSPLFTLVAVLTLAIGIGATTAVFSVVDGVLLKPLPYPNPDELVALWHDAPGAPGLAAVSGGLQISPSMLVTYRENNRSFASLGLWQASGANITGIAEPEQVPAVYMTGDLLETIGVPTLLGRSLNLEDEAPGKPPVFLLSYEYWQRRFGGDPNVLGKTLTVNSAPAEIVGVMPRGFRLDDFAPAVLGVFTIDRSRLIPPPFCCNGVARLKPGVTIEQANADVARMLPIWVDTFPFPGGASGREVYLDTWKIAPALRPMKANVVGNVGRLLWVVLGTVAVVLVIACANVTNLLLVRGEHRAQEIAVRAALGAGVLRLSRAFLLESVLLALGGGVLGVAIATGALAFLLGLAPQLPRLDSIALDWRALVFTFAVTAVAGVLLGLVPALRTMRAGISRALRGSGRGSSVGRERHRVQSTLVVGQVALTLVLLVGSGLMLRTFAALRAVDPGFTDPASVQTVRIGLPPQLVPDEREVLAQQRGILAAVAALPGVQSAAFASTVPMEGLITNWDDLDVEGRTRIGSALRTFRSVSPGLLKTMGTPLVAGRDIEWVDLEDARPVALVSENLARELWGTPEGALGKRIRTASIGPWREVVGVVGDVRNNSIAEPPPTIVYWPALMADFYAPGQIYIERFVALTVRSARAGTAPFARELERAVWSVNSSVPLALMRTMQDHYDRSLARTSFTLVMLAIAGAAALVLGVVGLYGVLSYAVSLRRREIAIRLALGAPQSRVTRRFMRYGAGLAAIGVAIGLVAAAALTRLMGTLLYDVRALDPLTYALVALVLMLAAGLASWLPARRAAAVDPAEVLAAE